MHVHATQNRSLRGFTLVELLVVVAIVIVLIGILLPSLSRATELTRRAACQGNIRAIAAGLVAYALDNDDAVPLACWQIRTRAVRRMNYVLSYRTPQSIPNGCPIPDGQLGMLIQPDNEYVDKGQMFYCPSATEPMWQYNNPEADDFPGIAEFRQVHSTRNLWWDHRFRQSGELVRLGYGVRPVTGWFNTGRPPWRGPGDPPLIAEELHNSNGKLPRMSTPTPIHYNGQRVMISFRSTDAMVADITNNPKRVDRFHVEGVNVGWFDGSVHWFDRGGFNDVWQQWPAGGYGNATVEDDCHYKLTPGVAGEVAVTGVWAEMGG